MAPKSKLIADRIASGFVPGLLFPLVIVGVFYVAGYSNIPFTGFIRSTLQMGILIKLITLCAFPNLLLFLWFIKQKSDRAARGVLMATFVYAFIVIFSKLI